MRLLDTHAHYFDDRFGELEGGAAAAIDESRAAGVIAFINAGTTPATSLEAVEMARGCADMYAAAGIHPTDCYPLDPEEALAEIEALCRDPRVVAVGEVGLDYHREDTDRVKQSFFLERQLDMAERLGLPVIMHDRDAHGDCVDVARAHKNVRGVFHSFSGSVEMARELVRMGWYIGIGGTVTYKNAPKVRAVAADIPLDRLLLETDCPYQPPVPYRGKINRSAYLTYVAAAIAEARGADAETVAEAACENACELFRIKP